MLKDFLVHGSVYCFLVVMAIGVLVVSHGRVIATNRTEALPFVYHIEQSDLLPETGGYVVIDELTGEVLFAHEADTLRPTASVIKLVVAAAAIQSNWLDETTTITASDIAAPEDFGKLVVGEVYTLRELLFPYLIESSNDAGAAIERTWGTELRPRIAEMIASAHVTDSVVVSDFNGLSAETKASPLAIAKLMQTLAVTAPTVLDITTLPQYVGQHPLVNNSPLVSGSAYRGGKHGYTPAAGKTVAVRFISAFPDGERMLIAVLFESHDTKEGFSNIQQLIKEHVARVPQSKTDSGILREL